MKMDVANAEVPKTCIHSNDQQVATPLVAKKSHFLKKSTRNYFSYSIYIVSKHFLQEFMISISSFRMMFIL